MRQGYRVIDTDTHVTPSTEVLYRYGDRALKERAGELQPYVRKMPPVPGRGHPETEYEILRIRPIPYERVAGQKAGAPLASGGGGARGALEGRVDNLAKKPVHVNVQHDNAAGRLLDMDTEGVDIDLIIPGTWAPATSALELGLAKLLY